jgi:transcriptional regulator with XRE-family HTH domain
MTRLSTRQGRTKVQTNPAPPIAANLRAAQAAKGITNDDLAREVGVGLRLLQKWRAGDVEPRYGNALKLAAVLDISVADLYADPEREAA